MYEKEENMKKESERGRKREREERESERDRIKRKRDSFKLILYRGSREFGTVVVAGDAWGGGYRNVYLRTKNMYENGLAVQ